MKIKVRQANMKDIDDILVIEEEAWPDGLRASEEQFISRIEVFPEGILVAEEIDEGNIVGVVVTEILNYDIKNPIPTWKEATDNGLIKKTHNPNGDTLYGVDLSVSRFANNASKVLILEIGKIIIRKNLKQAVLGARIPRYYKYNKRMDVKSYVYGKRGKRPYDPELGFYGKSGLQIFGILPDYIDDPESCNYGVLLCWKNPFYGRPFPKFWSWIFRK